MEKQNGQVAAGKHGAEGSRPDGSDRNGRIAEMVEPVESG